MIDKRLEPWSDELRSALDALNQGDVLGGLPFFYLGNSACAAFSPTLQLDPGQKFDYVWIREDDAPRYSIVTTQTCDICEEQADRPRKPFILVAPVYAADEMTPQNKFLIESIHVAYLRRLTGARFLERFWVADLRIQIPFDKGIVLGQPVHPGFATEDERRDFGFQLAELYSRPVLPGVVSNVIVDSLRDHFGNKRTYREQFGAAGIDEIRISCTEKEPYDVQLFVLVKDLASVSKARVCFDTWYAIVEPKAKANALRLLGVEYPLLINMSAETYRRTHKVRLPFVRLEPRTSASPRSSGGAPSAGNS